MKTQYQPIPAVQYIALRRLMENAEFSLEPTPAPRQQDGHGDSWTVCLCPFFLPNILPLSLSTGHTRVLASLAFLASLRVE